METLYGLERKALERYYPGINSQRILSTLRNKYSSNGSISLFLKKIGIPINLPISIEDSPNDYRFSHFLSVFLLGLAFMDFLGIQQRIDKQLVSFNGKINALFLWTIVGLFHDYGYFSARSFIRTDNLKDLQLDYSAFDDGPYRLRYSVNLYEQYYQRYYQDFTAKSHLYKSNKFTYFYLDEVGPWNFGRSLPLFLFDEMFCSSENIDINGAS